MRSGRRSRSDRRVTIEDIALAQACSASRVLDIPCKFWLKPNNGDIYYPALLRDALDKLRLDAKCGKPEIVCKAYPFLKAGRRVRIRGGCLDGLEGILVSENKDHSLVVSIEAIQRSLAIRIDGFDVEAI